MLREVPTNKGYLPTTRYLLQVWNRTGDLVYSRQLKEPVLEAYITSRCINEDSSPTFIYVPHDADSIDNHSDIHIVTWPEDMS